jgi:hypothetical protein
LAFVIGAARPQRPPPRVTRISLSPSDDSTKVESALDRLPANLASQETNTYIFQ